jgi:hypothetical protein
LNIERKVFRGVRDRERRIDSLSVIEREKKARERDRERKKRDRERNREEILQM